MSGVTGVVGALEYHRLTVHRPDRLPPHDPRLLAGFQPLRPDLKPPQFKTYAGLPSERLPDDLSGGGLDRRGLGRLLHLSAGVVRVLPRIGGPMWFRAAGSAGNLGPVEVYLLVGDLPDLAAGLYHYEPVEHALVRLRPVPGDTPAALVLTGVPWRTCWKYRERGFRHLWWDAGTMLAHVLAVASDGGLSPRVELGFVDAAVAAVVGAGHPHELPLAVVGLDGAAVLPEPEPVAPGHLADDPIEFPLVTAAYQAGALDTAAAVDAWRAAAALAEPGPTPRVVPAPENVQDLVLRRGSTRQFDPASPAPPELLASALPWAAGPVPTDAVAQGATLLEHFLLVHGVEGTAPGVLRFGADRGLVALGAAPEGGALRAVGCHLCLDQRLGGDGAATAFHCADLARVTAALGDRGYRAALLEAGVVEGRLHLAAAALGLGATGLTFYDEEVRRFFSTDAAPMLVTAVGVPAYRSRPGGPPRRPVRMRPL